MVIPIRHTRTSIRMETGWRSEVRSMGEHGSQGGKIAYPASL
jgi:hypothetical protein